MKKILYYSDCPFFGGCENILENLIKSQSINKNYEVFYAYRYNLKYHNEVNKRFKITNKFAIKLISNDNDFYRHITLRAKSNKFFISIFFRIIAKIFRFFKESGIYSIYNIFILYAVFYKIKPDIIHINNGGYPGASTCKSAVFAAKLLNIKNIIFTVNNLAYAPTNNIETYIDNKINNLVSYFTTASFAAKISLNNKRNFQLNKIINIPNTVLLEGTIASINGGVLNDYKNKVIVGSVGLLIKRKGFNIFIEAINFIKNDIKHIPTIFLIFGDGEDRLLLENLIKEYNLEKLIMLMGHKSNILEYIKDFDIFVLPSTEQEDFPYVNIEAMLLEKPIISTNVAGIPEQVINNENGYIVSPNNYQELGIKIKELIVDKEKRIEMGKKSKNRYFTEFSYDKIMKKYLDIYNSFFKNDNKKPNIKNL